MMSHGPGIVNSCGLRSLSGAFWSVRRRAVRRARRGAEPPASTSAAASLPATSAIHGELIPGIGATRANWDASHTLNAANNNGADYGDDPSLPVVRDG